MDALGAQPGLGGARCAIPLVPAYSATAEGAEQPARANVLAFRGVSVFCNPRAGNSLLRRGGVRRRDAESVERRPPRRAGGVLAVRASKWPPVHRVRRSARDQHADELYQRVDCLASDR